MNVEKMKRIKNKHKTFQIKKNVKCLNGILETDYKELSRIRAYQTTIVDELKKLAKEKGRPLTLEEIENVLNKNRKREQKWEI